MHHDEGGEPDKVTQAADDRGDRKVRRHDTGPCAPAAHTHGKPVLQKEKICRAQTEHDCGMAIEAITHPAEWREGQILRHREGIDVADPALVEISRRGMVNGVGAPPEIERRQGDDADHAADPGVGGSLAEEGIMAAVMLDHEKAHEERRRRDRKWQGQPVADVQCGPHQEPKPDQGPEGDQDLGHASRMAWRAVARENLRPLAGLVTGWSYRTGRYLGHRAFTIAERRWL